MSDKTIEELKKARETLLRLDKTALSAIDFRIMALELKGLPEKKKCYCSEFGGKRVCNSCIENPIIDLCKAWVVGKLEGIKTIIATFGQLTSKYPDKKHLLGGDETFISASQYDDLAEAIIQHFKGEK